MRKSKSALFLMELIIVIFFFAMTGAVCLQLFVKAHLIDVRTRNLNSAIRLAENTGELFYEYASQNAFDESVIKQDVPEGLSVTLTQRSDDAFLYLDYVCTNENNEEIYSITFRQHVKEVLHE